MAPCAWSELAQLRVALALGHRDRIRRRPGRALGLLVLGGRRDLGLQVGVGALDRGLDQLSVKAAVDDDRPAGVELDQHAGGAGTVDVLLGEADRRRTVGVTVELTVKPLALRVELLGLLAQPQPGDLACAGGVQVGGEHAAGVAGVGESGLEHPAGLTHESLRRPRVAVVQVRDHGLQQGRGDRADRTQLIDRGQRDRAVADHLLGALGQLEHLDAGADAGLGPAERPRGAGLGQAAVEHRPHRLGLLVRVQLLARDVLHRPVGVLGVCVADHHRHLGQRQRASGREPMEAGHVGGAHRLVEGQDVAQLGDGAVAVLGGDREQVMRAGRAAALAPLDVAANERGNQQVPLAELPRAVEVARAHRGTPVSSSRHTGSAGTASQTAACCR